MRSKTRPTAKQKRFWDWVARQPCIICAREPVEVHHVLGSTAKENGVAIGQWCVLPVCHKCHTDEIPVTDKQTQVLLFVRTLLREYWRKFREVPLTADELMAVLTWRR